MSPLATHLVTPSPVVAGLLDLFARPENGGSMIGWVIGRVLLVLLIVHVLLIVGALMVWAERRVSAWMQERLGPNRVGPEGLLQPLADLGKFMFKEDVVPKHVNKWIYTLAPAISVLPAMITFAVIPFTGVVHEAGPWKAWSSWQVADLNIGVLYILSMAGIGVYGVTLGGWASNSKYSLLGGVRASAQMISYELSLGLSIVPLVLTVGSLGLGDIVAWQGEHGPFLLYQPLAFFLFLVSSYAETNRLPFDMPESETELVAGYHTEYSSMKFALFFLAEYAHMTVGAALIVTLFCGGWTIPFLDVGPIAGLLAFILKTSFFLFLFIWVRWTIPRFRYDQLMMLGWGWFLPLALLNVLLTAAALATKLTWLLYVLPLALVGAALFFAYISYRREMKEERPLASDPNAASWSGNRPATAPGEGA